MNSKPTSARQCSRGCTLCLAIHHRTSGGVFCSASPRRFVGSMNSENVDSTGSNVQTTVSRWIDGQSESKRLVEVKMAGIQRNGSGRSVFTGFRWLDWNILHIESIVKPAHVPFRAIEIDRENN